MIDCREAQPHLSAFVDGTLTGADRDGVREHLASCDACRGLLQDLERLRQTARALGPRTPPDHVWLEVAGRIRIDEPSRAPARHAAPARSALAQWIGLAAALLLVTIGAYFFVRTPPDAEPLERAGNVPPSGTVEAVAEELNLAMQHYDRAIAELEAMAKTDDGTLTAVIGPRYQEDMQTIDAAIAESRTALSNDPGNEPARESLFEALRRKVVVLQATVTLMNEMRKGNQAAAAEAAAAFGKSS